MPLTLEQVREAFEKNPNKHTALVYIQVAIYDWEEGRLDVETYNKILELCRIYNPVLSI
jgi:hypothetical protein